MTASLDDEKNSQQKMASGVNGGNCADDHADQNQPPQKAGSGVPQEQPQPSTSGSQKSDGGEIPKDRARQQQPATSLPQPTASGGAVVVPDGDGVGSGGEETVPTLQELALRGIWMSWHLLWGIGHYFSHQPLSPQVIDGVLHSIRAAEYTVRWADHLAAKPQSVAWFIKVPIMVLLMVAKTGAELAETYLDIKLPKNRTVMEWLRNIARNLQRESAKMKVVRADRQDVEIIDPSTSNAVKIPEISIASLASIIIFSIPEEIAQEETVRDKETRVVEQLKEEKGAEGGVEKADDKREKAEKAQEGKEAARPETPEEKKADVVENMSDVVEQPEKPEEETVKDEKEDNKQIPKEKAPQGKEPTQPDTPRDADVVKQPKEKENEGTKKPVEIQDDESEEAEEKAQKGKAGELPAIAAGGAVKSEERPEQPAAAAAAAERCSAAEAERAAMGVRAQSSALTATSEALLAAEGSSQAEPSPSKPAEKPTPRAKAKAKAPKRKLLDLFRA